MAEASPIDASEGAAATPQEARDTCTAVVDNVARVVRGSGSVAQMVLLAIVAGGHVLIEDVPGVGKTSLAKALAMSIDGTFGRIQFTPDLLPSDVVGVSVYDRSTASFDFRPGPVFANVMLADEINRASPKTQAALLEAMAEQQVTVGGTTYALDPPFVVLATQNPAEHEGAYPLPDSQLDRFLLRVSMGYPAAEAEVEMLAGDGADDRIPTLATVASTDDLTAAHRASRSVHVAPALRRYLVELAAVSRDHPHLSLGMSPRATLSLQRVAQARALVSGRDFVVPDDVKALAVPTLAHRLQLSPEAALAGTGREQIVEQILDTVAVPTAPDRR